MKKSIIVLLLIASACSPFALFSQTGGAYDVNAMRYNPYFVENMVDLVTGDLVYNLDLGGPIPITLQYHAGITVDQPSSWVGLGWSYFPGAITRNVNCIPDDWNNKETEEYTSMGQYFPNLNLYNVFLNYKTQSYASAGLQAITGTSKNMFEFVRKTFNPAEIGNGIYKSYGSLYYKNAINGAAEPDIKTGLYGGMYSENEKHRLDFYSAQMNASSARDYSASANYFGDDNVSKEVDASQTQRNGNVMFPAYDNYRISGPGISGEIEPRMLNNTTIVNGKEILPNKNGQVNRNITYLYNNSEINNTVKDATDVYFYFVGDNSGYYKANGGKYECGPYSMQANHNFLNRTQNTQSTVESIIPEKLRHRYSDDECYNTTTKRPCTAKYTEWFSNDAIKNNQVDGFIECDNMIGTRDDANLVDPTGIGAFRVTLEDGTVYHYSLPVYQFEQFFRDEQSTSTTLYAVNSFNVTNGFYERRSLNKYAYSWYLTAITGSDYIDANNNGKVDEGDYGLWVKYNYGKWTDGYFWKTPLDGGDEYIGSNGFPTNTNKVIHRNYNWGRKEIYYLNSVKTRTHTAFFIKSIKDDGSGIVPIASETKMAGTGLNSSITGDWTVESTGQAFVADGTPLLYSKKLIDELPSITSISLLKLDKIVIVKNEDLFNDLSVFNGVITSNQSETVNYKRKLLNVPYNGGDDTYNLIQNNQFTFKTYFHGNVLEYDDNIVSSIISKSLYTVEFNYNYTHVKSYSASTSGKLALAEIKIKGLNENDLMPSYKFDYYSSPFILTNNPRSNDIDSWGFDFNHPNNWALEKITFPIGNTIEFTYSKDQFSRELFKFDSHEIFSVRDDGGLRVSEITVDDLNGGRYKTSFDYNIPSEATSNPIYLGSSSGMIFYKPCDNPIEQTHLPFYNVLPNPMVMYEYVKVINKGADNTSSLGSKIYVFETPNKLTETVNFLKSNFNNLSLQTENAILTINDSKPTLGGIYFSTFSNSGSPYHVNILCNIITIKENFAALGRPLGFFQYNNVDNGLISKTVFDYYPLDSISGGVYQESFLSRKKYSYRVISENSVYDNLTCSVFSKIYYPSVLQIAYSSSNGSENLTYFSKFDLITGAKISDENKKTHSSFSSTPAYTIPIYEEFGSKVIDNTYKNMLIQNAEQWAYDSLGNALNVSVNTWNKIWKFREYNGLINGDYAYNEDGGNVSDVWRPHKQFVWKGQIKNNGTYKNFVDKNFDWALTNLEDNSSNGWLKTSEILKYNHNSLAYEINDVSGNNSSIKTDFKENYVTTIGKNSNFNDFAHTSFEEKSTMPNGYIHYGNEILDKNSFGSQSIQMVSWNSSPGATNGVNTVNGIKAHTGNKYLKVTDAFSPVFRIAFNNEHPVSLKTYKVSVWIHENSMDNISLNCIIQKTNNAYDTRTIAFNRQSSGIIKINGWYLFSMNVELTDLTAKYMVFNVIASGNYAYIDDFRVQPVDVIVNSTVYDELGYKVAELNNDNIATFYEYNNVGKLLRIKKETVDYGVKTVSEYDYHYARQGE